MSKNTVLKLLMEAGRACEFYQDEVLRHLPCRRFQCDEIWSYIYAKRDNVPTAKAPPPEAGDTWTWTVLCADTKLVPTWRIGDRSVYTAIDLFRDLQERVDHRVQIIADGLDAYLQAVPTVFGSEVDFAGLPGFVWVETDRGAPLGEAAVTCRLGPKRMTSVPELRRPSASPRQRFGGPYPPGCSSAAARRSVSAPWRHL